MYRLPNIKILSKVRDGGVFATQRPSQMARGESGIIGGWETYRRHQAADFVGSTPSPSPDRLGYVELTEMGEHALIEAGYSPEVTQTK